MARTAASLGAEARISDYISLGVITSAFPEKAIRSALTETGKEQYPGAGVARARGDVLRHRPGIIYAGFATGSFTMPAGGSALVVWAKEDG